ncbi:MAG: hypothetical protein RSC76_09770, partial [Oscillospiraceae bacterium]
MKMSRFFAGTSFFLVFLVITLPVFAIEYFAPEIGVSFTVPEGWKEKPLSKDRDFIKVKYAPLEENGESILFGYQDIWNNLSKSEKAGQAKSDIDNSMLTISDVVEMLSTTTDKVSMVTFNDVEYFKCYTSQTATVLNQTMKVDMIVFMCIRDGIMYQFQCGEIIDGTNFYNDFENIDNALNSIFNQKTKLNYEIIIINNSEKKSLKSNYLRLLSL